FMRASSADIPRQQVCHQRSPAGLVAGANAGAVVSVEIFVEQDEILPMRIAMERLRAPVHRAPTVRPAKEDPAEPPRQLVGNLGERAQLARASGTLHSEAVAEVIVELAQRLDDQEVDGKPDRPAPV